MKKNQERPWLRECFERTGKSQRGVAKLLNVAPPRINEILDGERGIGIVEIVVMAKYLEAPLLDLLAKEVGKKFEKTIYGATLNIDILERSILQVEKIISEQNKEIGPKEKARLFSLAYQHNLLEEKTDGQVKKAILETMEMHGNA